jgi:3-hydroxybutyryl-CoA dehydrogenase
MARGIAVVFAYAGHRVTIVDVKARDTAGYAQAEADALAEVRQTLATLAGFGLFAVDAVETLMTRVSYAAETDAAGALHRGHLRRRARGAGAEARGVCARVEDGGS